MLNNNESGNNIIRTRQPAGEWAEGYQIGNGRIGGMVLGDVVHDRIGLNHDMLWRRFWTYQKYNTAGDMYEVRRLCMQGKWEDAHQMILKKVPVSSQTVYLNPFVPAGDLGLRLYHENGEVRDYERHLNMATGIVEVSYKINDISYLREYFCSWISGVMVIRLSADRGSKINGEIELSRLMDPDCTVVGSSRLGEIIMEGEFEEGVKFAVVTRIVQRGGRLTGGRTAYTQSSGEITEKDFGHKFIFKDKDEFSRQKGASTCIDSASEVIILTAIVTDDESGMGPADFCAKKLDTISAGYDRIKEEHIKNHQSIYNRVAFNLGGISNDIPDDEMVKEVCQGKAVPNALIEKMFNLGRYLAIASGRPQPVQQPSKAPINLQGIWNQDRHPAWEGDYHLDLNLEMCYWSLNMVNLRELTEPLMDWVEKLVPQARETAMDLFGCRGILFGIVEDFNNIGNMDDIGVFWTGAAAWVSQILWKHWECTGDYFFLSQRLYPFLKEVGLFYEDFLTEDESGRLIPCPSISPEMGIKGRKGYSCISSPSTIDLELIREVFSHLIAAAPIVDPCEPKCEKWSEILNKVPLPVIDKDGCLQEWLEVHESDDPGHRHRSHLIGLCPGDRITLEDTPDYLEAAVKALEVRHKFGRDASQSLTYTWDAQIFARLYDGNSSLKQLNNLIQTNTMDNLLITCNDWRDRGMGLSWFAGTKVYQIEASLCAMAAIAEMLMQDRRGLIRILPALPDEWKEGMVTGLCAAGGFEVEIKWDDGKFMYAKIKSLCGNVCRVKVLKADWEIKVACVGSEITNTKVENGIIEFDTIRGEAYLLT